MAHAGSLRVSLREQRLVDFLRPAAEPRGWPRRGEIRLRAKIRLVRLMGDEHRGMVGRRKAGRTPAA